MDDRRILRHVLGSREAHVGVFLLLLRGSGNVHGGVLSWLRFFLFSEGVSSWRLLSCLETLKDNTGFKVAILGSLLPLGFKSSLAAEKSENLNKVGASLEAQGMILSDLRVCSVLLVNLSENAEHKVFHLWLMLFFGCPSESALHGLKFFKFPKEISLDLGYRGISRVLFHKLESFVHRVKFAVVGNDRDMLLQLHRVLEVRLDRGENRH